MKKIILLQVFLLTLISIVYATNKFQKIGNSSENLEVAIRKYRNLMDYYENKITNQGNKNKQEKIKKELKEALNKKDDYGYTPLFYPIVLEDIDLVNKMLQYGANPNSYDDNSKTPIIFWALEDCNNSYIISSLLDYGADCNYPLNNNDYKNYTPLLSACIFKNQNPEIIKSILDKTTIWDQRVTIKDENEIFEFTPFTYLTYIYDNSDYLDLIEELIEKGININSEIKINNTTLTAFQYSVIHYEDIKKALIKLLIGSNADINSSFEYENNLYTPLFISVEQSNEFLFNELIKKVDETSLNTKIRYTDQNNVQIETTVLSYIIYSLGNEKNDFYEMAINTLLNRKADANIPLKKGNSEYTPLYLVVSSDLKQETKKKLCEILLTNGANPNKLCSEEQQDGTIWELSPIHYVADKNNIELYRLFEKYQGDRTLKDSKDYSAIDYKSKYINNLADKLDFFYEEENSCKSFLKDYGNTWNNFTGNYNETTSSEDKLNMAQIAILHGDIDTAKYLLDGKISWDSENSSGLNSLDLALLYNRDEIINFLLNKNIKIGKSIFCVIDKALKDGNTEYLSKFLENNSFNNISKKYGYNETPIDPIVYSAICTVETSSEKRVNVLKVLTTNNNILKFSKIGLNSKITKDGKYPALMISDENAIICLIKHGANLDLTDNFGMNIKDYAFKKNQIQVIEYFKENKIKLGESLFYAIENELNGHDSHILDFINIEGLSNSSKLRKTVQTNNSFITCGLIAYTTYINNKVALSQTRIKILKELIDFGLDINEIIKGGEYNGNTALIMSTINKNSEVVEFLLENGADANIQSKSEKYFGRTALFYAFENKDSKTINLILKQLENKLIDIQLNNSIDNNATLLMFLAKYGDFDLVNSLLPNMLNESKYCLEKFDKDGLTPFLYAAAFNPDYRIIKLFRMYGANVFATDKTGNNAYDLAKLKNNNQEILHRLESYGVYGK